MSNRTYDILKKIALIWLPAVTALLLAVSQVWGIPYGEQIANTLCAIDAFLGTVLKLSSDAYWDEGGSDGIGRTD